MGTQRTLFNTPSEWPTPPAKPSPRLADLEPARGSQAGEWRDRAIAFIREHVLEHGSVTADDVHGWVERTGDRPYNPNHVGSAFAHARKAIGLVNSGQYVISKTESCRGRRVAVWTIGGAS